MLYISHIKLHLGNKTPKRAKKTEALWIFFGIHISNALEIGRRKIRSEQQEQAA